MKRPIDFVRWFLPGLGVKRWLAVAVFGEASLGCGQGEHPLHVPGHGHKTPFAAHLIDPAQEKLPEAHD